MDEAALHGSIDDDVMTNMVAGLDAAELIPQSDEGTLMGLLNETVAMPPPKPRKSTSSMGAPREPGVGGSAGISKTRWQPQEDRLLMQVVEDWKREKNQENIISWVQIAERVPNRTPKQCRERYKGALDPHLNRRPFSAAERTSLVGFILQHGKAWSRIADALGTGRSELMIRNFYYARKRAAERQGYNTDSDEWLHRSSAMHMDGEDDGAGVGDYMAPASAAHAGGEVEEHTQHAAVLAGVSDFAQDGIDHGVPHEAEPAPAPMRRAPAPAPRPTHVKVSAAASSVSTSEPRRRGGRPRMPTSRAKQAAVMDALEETGQNWYEPTTMESTSLAQGDAVDQAEYENTLDGMGELDAALANDVEDPEWTGEDFSVVPVETHATAGTKRPRGGRRSSGAASTGAAKNKGGRKRVARGQEWAHAADPLPYGESAHDDDAAAAPIMPTGRGRPPSQPVMQAPMQMQALNPVPMYAPTHMSLSAPMLMPVGDLEGLPADLATAAAASAEGLILHGEVMPEALDVMPMLPPLVEPKPKQKRMTADGRVRLDSVEDAASALTSMQTSPGITNGAPAPA